VTAGQARAALLEALEAQGLRVAARGQDVAPPCVYVERYETASGDVALIGGVRSTFAVHWIPVRGTDDPAAEDAAMDAVLAAVVPLAVDTVQLPRSSVTIGDQSWPCFRGLVAIY
jgi:hypothetical protein